MARRRGGFPTIDELSPEQRAAVDAQLARDRRPAAAPAPPAESTPAPAAAPASPYRSKSEAAYAEFLTGLRNVTWRHERLRIGLPGKRTAYKPDFTVQWACSLDSCAIAGIDFDVFCVEVKGMKDGRPYWRTHGHRRRALDGAAELWSALRLPLFVAWRVDGVWKHERVEVRS